MSEQWITSKSSRTRTEQNQMLIDDQTNTSPDIGPKKKSKSKYWDWVSSSSDEEEKEENHVIGKLDTAPVENLRPRSLKSTKKSQHATPSSHKPNVSTPSSIKKTVTLTPTLPKRLTAPLTPSTPLQLARESLHLSRVPESLPCREAEFQSIHRFLLSKISQSTTGCMYISGVPGTGKTATVHAVMRKLKQEIGDKFVYVEMNALSIPEPKRAYSRILELLLNVDAPPEQAKAMLERHFTRPHGPCVLLIDELDYLCNKRQDVIYNILEYLNKPKSRLIILCIANTMDLPERTLKGKVSSRMGLTRLMFKPYDHHQLQEIVQNRLKNNNCFHPDAVQLVARKVAAVSGDARRALDICKHATRDAKEGELITPLQIQKTLQSIFSSKAVRYLLALGEMHRLLIRAIRDETLRTGVEETVLHSVYNQFKAIWTLEVSHIPVPTSARICDVILELSDMGLVIIPDTKVTIFHKISLNVSSDDIHYALTTAANA
ncbi:hypothetical protein M8J77_019915 [Diaphorina citri]|nr:hypothetical protein M8J77_019915 [Diaphorina citri]